MERLNAETKVACHVNAELFRVHPTIRDMGEHRMRDALMWGVVLIRRDTCVNMFTPDLKRLRQQTP